MEAQKTMEDETIYSSERVIQVTSFKNSTTEVDSLYSADTDRKSIDTIADSYDDDEDLKRVRNHTHLVHVLSDHEDFLYYDSEKELATINYSEFISASARKRKTLSRSDCGCSEIERVTPQSSVARVPIDVDNGGVIDGESLTDTKRERLRDLKEKIAEVYDAFGIDTDRDQTVVPTQFMIESKKPRAFVAADFARFRTDLTVRVPLDVGGFKVVSVLVENHCLVKEWLGGYRNPATNVEYHHALAQTTQMKEPKPSVSYGLQVRNISVNQGTQMSVDKNTQMWRPDCYIPSINDRIVKTDPNRFKPKTPEMPPRPNLGVTLSNVPVSKSRWRSTAAKISRCLRTDRTSLKRRNAEQSARNKRFIMQSVYPLNREDFYLLYLIIGKWWNKSIRGINETKEGSARKASLSLVLDKEINLINIIENQRRVAKYDLLRKQWNHFLETCARPIIFRDRKGTMSSVDTLATQQAREQLEIFSSYLSIDSTMERIDTIVSLKGHLNEYGPYENTQEIITLLDRECDLLKMGCIAQETKYLRDRVIQLLVKRLKTVRFNSAAINYRKPIASKTDSKYYQCLYCGRLKLASDYPIHVKLTAFVMCTSCTWVMNVGHQRIDYSPFARILGDVRQSEMMKSCDSSVCFVLQTIGMHYLVNRIWLCKSILSSTTDVNLLQMVRFRKDEDWAPWNCILLTTEEAVKHASIPDVYSFYNTKLLNEIKWRHLRAKSHFRPLLVNSKFMSESELWFNVQDTGRFLHPSHITRFAGLEDFEF